MKKNTIVIIIASVALLVVLFLLFLPQVLSRKKTGPIELQAQGSYGSNEDVVLRGTTASDANIAVLFSGKIGFLRADATGNWSVNLGKLPIGIYYVQLLSDDSPTLESVVSASIAVGSESFALTDMVHTFAAALVPALKNPPVIQLIPLLHKK